LQSKATSNDELQHEENKRCIEYGDSHRLQRNYKLKECVCCCKYILQMHGHDAPHSLIGVGCDSRGPRHPKWSTPLSHAFSGWF
jgi:hypothetical protein